jgi:hypothetical protein
MSATLLWTLAAARASPALLRRSAGAFLFGLHGRVEQRVPPEGAISVFSLC